MTLKNNEEYGPYIDRRFRLPRVWSNRELAKFAHLFKGDIANVSGWKDIDKEGKNYREYFSSAESYTITNYKSEARGFQGGKDEVFLDLTADLPEQESNRFDVVFNHTVLEHVYEVQKAFKNLCLLSKDVVIVVVPFLQEMHADYGDFWRFTPLVMKNMYEENGFDLHYLSFNGHKNASVYLFCIGLKPDSPYKAQIPFHFSFEDPTPTFDTSQDWVGCHAIDNKNFMNRNSLFNKLKRKLKLV
ncbi:hypothetical protein BFP97_08995 [Roseivirga sp. 4D4]|uniref:hypothetical protein n=1 Tax=Roseivirga sp. 4D4 TaxID=1889784 RepID=UPI00085290D6|nr:hypothetical protein [Roseivirga sp. 4D4]OEK01641.1 hypothetical protein BFP97_08995 [Roseivirga sp. 4D4]